MNSQKVVPQRDSRWMSQLELDRGETLSCSICGGIERRYKPRPIHCADAHHHPERNKPDYRHPEFESALIDGTHMMFMVPCEANLGCQYEPAYSLTVDLRASALLNTSGLMTTSLPEDPFNTANLRSAMVSRISRAKLSS